MKERVKERRERRKRGEEGREKLMEKSKFRVPSMHSSVGPISWVARVREPSSRAVQSSSDRSESVQPAAGLRATSPQWQAEFLESKRVELLLETRATWARSPGQGPHPGGGDAPWGRAEVTPPGGGAGRVSPEH